MENHFALRIDGPDRKSLIAVVKKFNKYIKADKFLYSFELGKKTEKPHIHGHLYIERDIKVDTVAKWIREQKWYLGKGSSSFVPVRTLKNYKDYCVKDMDILLTNYEEEEIEDLLLKASQIKIDKQLKMVDKIYNFITDGVIDEKGQYTNGEILHNILKYYDHLKEQGNYYLLPNRQQMFQYVATIQHKLQNEAEIDMLYKNLF